ncbi:MAG TPA: [protein-PII] uridylyltransferase [Deltaproteobacteria bacterium]|nr:[protein-PII] uridylyltransferase [Deltaproteobacteria bacterium]
MSTLTESSSLKPLSESSPKYLTSELIEFKIGPDVTASVRDYWQRCRDLLCKKQDEKMPMERVVRLQSLMTDRMIIGLFKHGFEQSVANHDAPIPLALFALGGYGRAELNLFSDIDLLFLYEGKLTSRLESVAKQMLYPLWDAGLQLGYATRTLADCKRVMKEDARAMSSMLDARFLVGDREPAEKFLTFLESKFASPKALRQFVSAKAKETEERVKRFGSSVYMLEPNLKESEGGLRDWHLLRYYARIALKSPAPAEWVRRGLLSEEEADELRRTLNFLWDVRNRLHRRAGKCQDQLTFELQEPIAAELGFTETPSSRAAEKFRQAYYGHAATLHRSLTEVSRRLLRPPESLLQSIRKHFKTPLDDFYFAADGFVVPRDYAALESHPVEWLRAFDFAQKNRWEVDADLKFFISRRLHAVDDKYRRDPQVGEMLRGMFQDIAGIGKSLGAMHDCRLLGAILPEFGDILFQTQHDVYHIYTVDAHSIFAVQELSKLAQGSYDAEFPLFKKTLGEIRRPDLLAWSILFHDIGKGKGGNHSERGAEIAQAVMTRLHYPEEDIREVEFQVRSHLLMPHLSQRRDLEDFNLISQFARSMESLDRLSMLFILTWADIRAVGPEVWTPWKGILLQDLYQKTRRVLETGEFNPERALTLMRQAKEKVLETAALDDPALLKTYLDTMPPRYFLANTPEAILGHFEILREAPDRNFVFHGQVDPYENVTKLLIYTFHSPRLFEQVTGVLASNQVNILALEQFFNSRGKALLLLRVMDQRGAVLEEERRLQALERDLKEVLSGRLPMEKYLQLNRSSFFPGKKVTPGKAPRVEIDNDVSAYYTVIDVYANDRIGLLHDLARSMRGLSLYIEVSKISTKVDQVADVFYVKDIFGHKITDSKKLAGIKKALLETLTETDVEGR